MVSASVNSLESLRDKGALAYCSLPKQSQGHLRDRVRLGEHRRTGLC